MLQQDADLPGVLVLIYTIRKYSQVDRDIIVFVAGNVRSRYCRAVSLHAVLVATPVNIDARWPCVLLLQEGRAWGTLRPGRFHPSQND